MGWKQKLHLAMIRSVIRSRAGWVVIPMQDILGLGSEARMNKPGTAPGNWEWRMHKNSLKDSVAEELRSMTVQSGRGRR
jgi:4-alpha-glucanotransferase